MLRDALDTLLDRPGLWYPKRVIHSHVYPVNLAICAKTDMIALLPGFAVDEVSAVHGFGELDNDLQFKSTPLSMAWRADTPPLPVVERFHADRAGWCAPYADPVAARVSADTRSPRRAGR